MQSALDPFLTACALTSLTMALRPATRRPPSASARARWFFAFGLCLGIQTLNRPHVLLPALAIVLLLWSVRRKKPAVIAAAGLVVAMLPVVARNLVTAGQWSLVSSHGGLNFYIGNNESATGLYQLVPGIRPDIDGQREDTRRVAEAATGRPLSDAGVSDYFSGLAWSWIRREPVAAARLFGKKILLSIHADHVALPHSFEFFASDVKTALRWLALNGWVIMPLGLAGLLFATPRGSPDETMSFRIWAAFVPAYMVALAVFFLAERYRLPLFVPLCVSAGMFVDWLLTRIADRRVPLLRRELLVSAGVVMVLATVTNWPFRLADAREGDRLRMVRHAASQHDTAEAERWAALVVASSSAPAEVEARVGRIYLSVAQPETALRHFRTAESYGARSPELLVDIAESMEQLGDRASARSTLLAGDWAAAPAPLSLRAGRLAMAVEASELAATLLRRATEADPTNADAWAQLGFAFLFSSRPDDAERALKQAARLNPSDAVAQGGLAVSLARQGKTDEALKWADSALALDPAEPLATQVRVALRGR